MTNLSLNMDLLKFHVSFLGEKKIYLGKISEMESICEPRVGKITHPWVRQKFPFNHITLSGKAIMILMISC